jgi:hypothetical protein
VRIVCGKVTWLAGSWTPITDGSILFLFHYHQIPLKSLTQFRYQFRRSKQCFGSGSTWIRIQLVAWIRIRIRNADPDPDLRGIKSAKMKKN